MSTTRHSSTSAPNSCITGRARRCSTIWNTTTRTSIRTWPRSGGSSISCCARCRRRAHHRQRRRCQLAATLAAGCWTPCETFSCLTGNADADWSADIEQGFREPAIRGAQARAAASAEVDWRCSATQRDERAGGDRGRHHVGVAPERAAQALGRFRGVKRRMEVRGTVGGVTVYDDFAHHPTAIETTLARLARAVGAARDHRGARAALEHHEARRASRAIGAGA
jgi:hypothetical protein